MLKIINWKRSFSSYQKSPFYLLITILGLLSMVGLSAALICIYFGRPIGDDIGAIAFHHSNLWFNHAVSSLQTTGRYGQSVLATLAYGILGRHIGMILPLVVILWLFWLITLFATQLDTRLKLKLTTPIKLVAAATFVFLTLIVNVGVDGTPPQTWITFQTFFWPSGIITYTVSLLAFMTALYFSFIRIPVAAKTTNRRFITYAVLVYLFGLFNEVQPATLLAISLGLFIFSFIPYKTKLIALLANWRNVFVYTAAPSLLSLLTLFFSAGNSNRRATTGAGHASLADTLHAVVYKVGYTLDSLYFRPHDLVLILAISFVCAYAYYLYRKKIPAPLVNLGILIGLLLIVISIGALCISTILFVVGYGIGTGILPRTFLIPQLFYTAGLLTLFTSLGIRFVIVGSSQYLRQSFIVGSIAMLLVILFFIPRYIDKVTTQLSSTISYATAWDYQDSLLRADATANPNRLVFIPGDHAGLGDGFSLRCTGPTAASTDWLNQSLEQYYGIKQICADADKPLMSGN